MIIRRISSKIIRKRGSRGGTEDTEKVYEPPLGGVTHTFSIPYYSLVKVTPPIMMVLLLKEYATVFVV